MEATIKITDDSHLVKIIIDEDDGSRIEKKITRQTFRSIFKVEEKNEYFCRNRLFDNLEGIGNVEGLLYGNVDSKTVKGLFFVPADLRYMDVVGEKRMIPYPSLLFCLEAKMGSMVASHCFAIKEKDLSKLNLDVKLYNFPFGNVNPHDHHICWGNNRMNNLCSYKDLRGAIGTFFYSESNKDYVSVGVSYAKKYGTYENFLGQLQGKSHFPKDALVRCHEDLTLKHIFDRLIIKEMEE